MRKLFYLLSLAALSVLVVTTSCKKDDPVEPDELRSRFTATQDVNDPFTWTFENASLGAVSYAWTFGDGGTDTAESPTHTYASEGDYTVTLVVTGADGATNSSNKEISVVDPDVEFKKLTGETSKTWKLLRTVNAAAGEFPVSVGPADRSQIWYALGLQAPIASRPCLMEEEYIFSFNGDYEYRPKDNMIWAEAGVWPAAIEETCIDYTVPANMVNIDGADISDWGAGTYTFDYDVAAGTLTLMGSGAHVGSAKVGTDAEYTTPQLSVTYKVISLETDGPVDMMVLETELPQPGYWQFRLVAYDNPNDEPELPMEVVADFSGAVNGRDVTFTNSSTNATSYSWDFGDGGTSAESNPTHTYATDGLYTVTLTATGAAGSIMASQTFLVCTNKAFTASDLHGDGTKTWKLYAGSSALKVGPCKGCGEGGNWFATNLADVTTRACTFDDTYTFDNAGNFTYVTNGDIWGEAYMGLPDGACAATAALAGGAVAWGDGNHTFSVVDGDPASITVTGTGAFIGLAKAFNGGEYSTPTPAVDGSVTYEVLCYLNDGNQEIVVITVDISAGQTGGAYWTFTLQAE